MNINFETKNNTLLVFPEGRLDTTTAPELESALDKNLKEDMNVIFDFEKLDYLSSAGLRVLLATQQKINGYGGEMVLKNVCESVVAIMNITGFSDILTIE